ncbi:MAG: hypothetical protein ACYC55_10275 [Candidatus Geothermincolia bacterium]
MGLGSLKGRTVREFAYQGDFWQKLDEWAASTGYNLAGSDEASRLYRKGSAVSGALFLPNRFLKASVVGDHYRLEAWVRMGFLNRLSMLWLVPAELIIDSGTFLASLPRSSGRKEVNQLLLALGVPEIS